MQPWPTRAGRRTALVALHAVMDLWRQRERPASELHDIRRMLKGHSTLVRIMNERAAPPAQNEEIEKTERTHRQKAAAHEARKEQRLEKWRQWRTDTLADPEGAFSAEKRTATVSNLYSWLRASHQDQNRFNIWDKKALTEAFGTDVAQRAEQTFRALWRENKPPVLWSSRPPADRNETPHDWIYGLMGVSAESSTPGWTDSLSPAEARIAAVYGTIELNGFAPFIADLTASHPKEVDAAIGGEVSAELDVGDHHDNLPALQDVTYGNEELKRLLTQRLLAELRSLPHTFADETGLRWAYHLGQVFRVLNESEDTAVREAVAQECVNRCEADPVGTLSLAWLRGLFRFDPVRGTKILIDTLAGGNDAESRERANKAFASLFGGRDVVGFQIAKPAQRARVLGQLVRCAYSFISPRDDRYHADVYTLDLRDDAQNARNFLLSGLLDTPGPEAVSVILALADEEDFAQVSDRLRLRARQRAAADAEFTPFDPDAVVAIEKQFEVSPHDRDGLFAVMMERLGDLAYDVAHHDFTDRQTLGSITEEREMQRTLAWRIKERAKCAYKVALEEEVADQKRPDIRLLAVNGDQKAAIELKIADHWSFTKLESALQHQLVERYLRDVNCKAGCLLLTYHGRKKYWVQPKAKKAKKHLNFLELVALLNAKARALEEERRHDVRISVFGINLKDLPGSSPKLEKSKQKASNK